MSRTFKDQQSKKTIRFVLEVFRNDDGTYEVFWKGELVRSRVQERWLNEELCVRYGFCGEEYDAIVRQLSECGKATVVL